MKQDNMVYVDGKKAVLYLRVSTEEQVDNFSLDTQRDICTKEALKRGYEVTETFREEGRSAKTITGRPILIELLEYCRKNKHSVQAVIVYRLDRISRITADYLAIRKKLTEQGVTIISATEPTGDSPTEKLVETILAGFAQLDNDIRSERSKNGLRARYLSGMIVTGQVPLGYIVQVGYAVKDPLTWDLMKKAWDLMATGSKSLQEMADLMNEWGLREYKSKKEYPIRAQRANVIFRNKFYLGKLTSKTYKEEISGKHIPMITEEQYYRVQATLDGRNPNMVALAKRTHVNPDFPLRRIVSWPRKLSCRWPRPVSSWHNSSAVRLRPPVRRVPSNAAKRKSRRRTRKRNPPRPPSRICHHHLVLICTSSSAGCRRRPRLSIWWPERHVGCLTLNRHKRMFQTLV